jgi:hypothetical protein
MKAMRSVGNQAIGDDILHKGMPLDRTLIRSARWFWLAGWALIGSALNTILFSALPLKLAESAWQLKMIGQTLSSSTFLLIGVLLVCCARTLNPSDTSLRSRADLLRVLAGWFAILLILFIPLQLYAGIRALRQLEATEDQALSELRKTILIVKSTTTEDELRSYLASLPDQPPLPARFDAPFQIVKERGLATLSANLNAATNRSELQRSQRWQTFIAEATRNAVHALLMAIGFNGFAIARDGGPSFLKSLLPATLQGNRRPSGTGRK